jgi:hypothetical protein
MPQVFSNNRPIFPFTQCMVVALARARLGPPGAIGEKFTVSQHGHEDVSHEQRPLYLGKQRVVQYGISCTYGCTAVLLRTIGTCDRDPRSL